MQSSSCGGLTINSSNGSTGGGHFTVPVGDYVKTQGSGTFFNWAGPNTGSIVGFNAYDGPRNVYALWPENGAPIPNGTLYAKDGGGQFEITGPYNSGVTFASFQVYGLGITSASFSFTVTKDAAGNVPDHQPSCPAPPLSPGETKGCNPSSAGVCKAHKSSADPVDTDTGNFHADFTDFDIPGRGGGLNLTRSYNSLGAATPPAAAWPWSQPFGPGWSFSYGMYLTFNADGTITVNQENGSQVTFTNYGTTANPFWGAPTRDDTTFWSPNASTYTFVRHGSETFTFDKTTGRLISESDPDNNTINISYNGSGQISAVTDATAGLNARTLTFQWSGTTAGSVVTSVMDNAKNAAGVPTPRTVTYGYTSTTSPGDVSDVTDVGGDRTHFGYDNASEILTIQTPRYVSNTCTQASWSAGCLINFYSTTVAGKVVKQFDALDRETDFNYAPTCNPACPYSTLVTMPLMKQLLPSTDPGFGDTDRFKRLDTYDPSTWALAQEIDGYSTANQTWKYAYDPESYGLAQVTDPNNAVVFNATYDFAGNTLSQTDGLGRTWQVDRYNQYDEPDMITDPLNESRSYLYNTDGTINLANVQQPDPTTGAPSSTWDTQYFTYDPSSGRLGDLLSVKDLRGNLWQASYDVWGNVASETAPPTPENSAGDQRTFTYDNVGRLVTSVSPKGNLSGLTQAQIAAYTTTYTSDAYGSPLTATSQNSAGVNVTTQTHYDQDHNVDWTKDANGNQTQYAYDSGDELTKVTRPDLTTNQYRYFGDGQLATQLDGNANMTSYAYDTLGRVTKVTDPDGQVPPNLFTGYSWDNDNRLQTVQAPGGSCSTSVHCTTYGYDQASELKTVTYSDGGTNNPNITNITYDLDGRRQTMVTAAGTSSWNWDSMGRLMSTSTPSGGMASYGWDLNNNLTSIAYPGGTCPGTLCVQRSYDAANKLTSVTDFDGQVTNFTYDPDSNNTGEAFPTAPAPDNFGYAQNGSDALQSVTPGTPSTQSESLAYTRDGAEQVKTMTQGGLPGNASETYGYDPNERLGSLKVGTGATNNFSYNANDTYSALANGTQEVSDPAERLCYSAPAGTPSGSCTTPPSAATKYQYDDSGNRTATVSPSNSAAPSTGYGYNQANQMSSFTAGVPNNDGGQYTALATPARLLNSTPLAAGGSLAVQVTGQGGIPTTGVASVVLNVTDLGSGGSGAVAVYPQSSTVPGTSNINFSTGQTISNQVITGINPTNGQISVTSEFAASNVIVDIVGWYATASGTAGGTFTALTPARLLDTRTTNPPGTCASTCATIPAGGTLTLNVAGHGGVPASGVASVAVNATAVNESANGYLRLWPTGGTEPSTSNLNYSASQVLSELAIVKLSASGQITIRSLSTSDVIIDVFGWFSSTANPAASTFTAASPQRILDTRSATRTGQCVGTCSTLGAGGTIKLQVTGQGGVPVSGVTAVVVNLTGIATTSPGGGSVVAYKDGVTTPTATSLTELGLGLPVANTAIVPVAANGMIDISSQLASDLLVDVEGWYSSSTTFNYSYDPDGFRSSKSSASGTTSYTWDRADAELISQTSGSSTTYFIYGPNGQVIEQMTGNGTSNPALATALYYHQDQLGSTRSITGVLGAVLDTFSYDLNGNLTARTGADPLWFGYAGAYLDAETGFYHLLNRYYDPVTAQFTTRDPLAALSQQPYQYAGDNPLNYNDPSGLLGKDLRKWFHDHGLQLAGALAIAAGAACILSGVCDVAAAIAGIAEIAADALDLDAAAAVVEDGLDMAGTEFGGDVTGEVTGDVVGDGGEAATGGDTAADGPSCGGLSFSSDTRVEMADGTTKKISQIHVGDRVLATDTATGKTEPELVTTLWLNHDTDLLDLTISDGRGSTGELHTTGNHPIWDVSRHAWVLAADLRTGDLLRQLDGQTATVIALMSHSGTANMWDLTVANDHDFFVGTGSHAVLVHNLDDCTDWAEHFIDQNGGEMERVGSPDAKYPMEDNTHIAPESSGWYYHDYVVRDGMAYDETYPNGLPVDQFRSLFPGM